MRWIFTILSSSTKDKQIATSAFGLLAMTANTETWEKAFAIFNYFCYNDGADIRLHLSVFWGVLP